MAVLAFSLVWLILYVIVSIFMKTDTENVLILIDKSNGV